MSRCNDCKMTPCDCGSKLEKELTDPSKTLYDRAVLLIFELSRNVGSHRWSYVKNYLLAQIEGLEAERDERLTEDQAVRLRDKLDAANHRAEGYDRDWKAEKGRADELRAALREAVEWIKDAPPGLRIRHTTHYTLGEERKSKLLARLRKLI